MTAGNYAGAVIAAVITAAVAVIVTVLTQVWTSRRAQADLRYSRRRDALIAVQDAALDLRTALARYGQQLRESAAAGAVAERPAVVAIVVPDQIDVDQLRAAGRLEVCRSRVDDVAVVEALVSWQQDATAAFLSTLDVTAAQEQAAWERWTALVGSALRSGAGTVGVTSRSR